MDRYLTKKPKLEASVEFHGIMCLIAQTDEESFEGLFSEWEAHWSDFLKERNMPYLWTWYDNIECGIPNTNNSLEGQFTDLKTKPRNHNGLSKNKRMKFIDQYFKASFEK